MRTALNVILICFLPVLCFAPESEFGKISKITAEACECYSVDRNHMDALFFCETKHKNIKTFEARICKYAYGPGQILLNTARGEGFLGNESELENISVSIPLSVKFVARLVKNYKNDWQKITSHYKTGKARYTRYVEKHNTAYQELLEANPPLALGL